MRRFRRSFFRNNNLKNKIKQTNTRINNLQNQMKRIKTKNKINKKYERRNNIYNKNNFKRNLLNNNQNVIKYNKPKNVIQRNTNLNNKNSIIRGKDLVIEADNRLVNQESGVYAIIPINPLYWQGTRAKNMAVQYQYYTPKTLSIEYVPTVSKFQQGTVTIGCVSNQIISQNSIQQTLIASTSGETFSCSEYFNKNIALGSLLQQKKLLLTTQVDKESIPFYIVIYLTGVISNNLLIAPGSIYLNYNIEFYNPVAETMKYKTENSIKLRDIDFSQQNITALLLEQNSNFGINTKIDVEIINGQPIFRSNNSIVELDLEKQATVLYSSPPDYNNNIVFDLSGFNLAQSSASISLLQNQHLLIIEPQQELFYDYLRITSGNISVQQGQYYKVISQTPDLISALQGAPFTLSQFGTSESSAMIKGFFYNVEFKQ